MGQKVFVLFVVGFNFTGQLSPPKTLTRECVCKLRECVSRRGSSWPTWPGARRLLEVNGWQKGPVYIKPLIFREELHKCVSNVRHS